MNILAWAGPRVEKSFRSSFGFAWGGLRYAYQTQRHLRFHVAAGAGVIALGAALRVSTAELAILIGAITLVVATELINTVVEAVVDLVTAEYHPLAKAAKDVAAGTVLAAAIGAAAIGVVVLLPPLWRLLGPHLY